jgi:DNA-binding transcriptional LysR family regulator
MARIGDRSEMEAFVRAVDLGGFSAAARELGVTPSALSKLVSRLEASLQVRLLERTTRTLRPTPEGELLLAHCRRILAEIEDAEGELTSAAAQPRGRLRLHAGVGFGSHQLVPALPSFAERFPEVEVELILEDRPVDLARERIDISVWPGPPADGDVVARKLCDFDRVLCAAPSYRARRGLPDTPDDLAAHDCITLCGLPAALAPWTFRTPTGRRAVAVGGPVSANNAECIRRLALLGLGIARLNEFMVGDDLRAGRLVPVLAEAHCGDPLPMNVLYPHVRHRLPRVAAMLAFLVEGFADAPWRRPRQAAGEGRAAGDLDAR